MTLVTVDLGGVNGASGGVAHTMTGAAAGGAAMGAAAGTGAAAGANAGGGAAAAGLLVVFLFGMGFFLAAVFAMARALLAVPQAKGHARGRQSVIVLWWNTPARGGHDNC